MESIEQLIYQIYEQRNARSTPRKYLGGSTIGFCERRLWFTFRKMCHEKFEGRMLRLFQYGHDAEPRFIEELKAIGMEIQAFDTNGKQFEVSALNGWFSGHADGKAFWMNEELLIEFKTHNAKSFDKLIKERVRAAKWEHFAQMQTYMGKMGLKRALYFAECKDDSRIYTEFVDFDQAVFDELMNKAERIVTSSRPVPDSCYAEKWLCPYCPAVKLCKRNAFPLANCLSCCYHELGEFPNIYCKRNGGVAGGKAIPKEVVDNGCKMHLFIPTAMPFDYEDAVPGEWVSYKLPSGLLMYNATVMAMPPIDTNSKVPQIFTSAALSGKEVKHDQDSNNS